MDDSEVRSTDTEAEAREAAATIAGPEDGASGHEDYAQALKSTETCPSGIWPSLSMGILFFL